MLDIGKPRCEATVSPELVRLLRGETRRAVTSEALAQDTARAADCPEGTDSRDLIAKDDGDWPLCVLRIDGSRPMRFRGLRACERIDSWPLAGSRADTRVVRSLVLYLASDGRLVGHASWHNEGRVTARPVFRAAVIASQSDFDRLVASVESVAEGDPGSGAPFSHLSRKGHGAVLELA